MLPGLYLIFVKANFSEKPDKKSLVSLAGKLNLNFIKITAKETKDFFGGKIEFEFYQNYRQGD